MLTGVTARLCPDPAAKRKWLIGGGVATGVLLLIIIIVVSVTVGGDQTFTAQDILNEYPLLDGHNELPSKIFRIEHNELGSFSLNASLQTIPSWNNGSASQTDIGRLVEGRVAGQFWSAHADCSSRFRDGVSRAFEQIDVIRRLIAHHPHALQFADSAQAIRDAFKEKRIASLIGVAGGHLIDSRLSVLRALYAQGARYLALTHDCHTPWAESHIADRKPINASEQSPAPGLTAWGKTLVEEANRLGLLIDLSHASQRTQTDVLAASAAPVIFSHSAAFSIREHTRNVQSNVLQLLKAKGGVLLVSFDAELIAVPGQNITLALVADHIERIRNETGSYDHIGLGADFDGTSTTPIAGLEDVSKYPALITELIRRGWKRDDLGKLVGGNVLRVLERVEAVRDEMAGRANAQPLDLQIPNGDLQRFDDDRHKELAECRSAYVPRTVTTTAPPETTVATQPPAATTVAPKPDV